jgi:ADP-heptose:LPS heptosyltransferase
LTEVVGILRSVDQLVTIDSGVNHIARLLALEITSFWGPTDPETRLLQMPGLKERVVYNKIFCAPCVHHIDFAPCLGNNICMKQHLGHIDIGKYEESGWSIDRETSLL